MMGSQKVRQRVLVILNECEESFFLTGSKILRGVYPEPEAEILRFAQDDSSGLFERLTLLTSRSLRSTPHALRSALKA